MKFDEFLKQCTACGGNWSAMLMTGIERVAPDVYKEMPDRSYTFEELCFTINRFLCASHDAFVGRFIGDCEVDKLIPLYSLSADEYARAYKKYKLKKFPGSISPVNLIERI